MEIEASIPPLKIKIKKLCNNYVLKIFKFKENYIIKKVYIKKKFKKKGMS